MNQKSMRLGIILILAASFFLLARVSSSDDDHAGHAHGPDTPNIAQKLKTDPDPDRHGHMDPDQDEGPAPHIEHGEADHGDENDHEGHDHDNDSHGQSVHREDADHDNHEHEDFSGSVDDGHDHGEDDQGDAVLELTEAQKREINLALAQAGPGSLHNELSLMGEIRLNQDRVTHVVPKVSGVVRTVGVSLGDAVTAGQILASIDSAELAGSEADYLEKQRQLEIAKKAYKRKKYLREEKIASEAGWLEKEAEYLNAETALKTARGRLVVSGLTEEEIQALPDDTDAQFGRYALRAPMSGTVIEKHITMGEKLSDDSEVFTIADLNLLWVDLKIPARDIYRVRQGIEVVIQTSNNAKETGTITLIGPVVDEATRTALARVMLDNRDGRWKPGTFVTGHVRISARNLPMVVTLEAVQNIEGKDFVFVQDGDAFKPVPVVVGRRDRKKVEIVSGLKPGTSHVTRGAFELKAMMITSSLGSHAGHGH